jgi:hypothetical protein
MTAVRMPTVINAQTNPIVHPSLSMTYLLLICSAVSGLPDLKCKSGAAGLKSKNIYGYLTKGVIKITEVNVHETSTAKTILLSSESCNKTNRLWNSLELYPVNISGKYQGSEPQAPGGTAFPAFYRRLIQDIALMGICRAWMRASHWLAFLFPLCCKVPIAASCLLY